MLARQYGLCSSDCLHVAIWLQLWLTLIWRPTAARRAARYCCAALNDRRFRRRYRCRLGCCLRQWMRHWRVRPRLRRQQHRCRRRPRVLLRQRLQREEVGSAGHAGVSKQAWAEQTANRWRTAPIQLPPLRQTQELQRGAAVPEAAVPLVVLHPAGAQSVLGSRPEAAGLEPPAQGYLHHRPQAPPPRRPPRPPPPPPPAVVPAAGVAGGARAGGSAHAGERWLGTSGRWRCGLAYSGRQAGGWQRSL